MTPSALLTELQLLMANRSDYTDARGRMHISQAEQELAYALRFPEVQSSGSITLTSGVREYTLSAFIDDLFAIYSIYYPTLGRKLERKSIDYFDRIQTFPAGPPSAYMRYGGTLSLDATPSSSEDGTALYVRYAKILPEITGDSTAFTLPTPYHEAILLGAYYRALRAFREFEQAELVKADYIALVRSRMYILEEEAIWDSDFATELMLGAV